MYQVAVVGCGVIGNRLAEAFAGHEETTVWGACDVDEQRVESFAEEYDCEAFTDYETMLARDAVDVVYVGVPPKLHRDVVACALDHGRHVICEKPIAEDATVGAEMVDRARESEQATAINLPFRYTPGFVELRERVEAGELGEPRRIDLRFRFPQWPREWQDVDWLESREQGGPLREVGTHFLFGVQELFGPIETVSARVDYTAPERYEESIVGYFTAAEVPGVLDLACEHEQDEENSITVLGSETEFSLTAWHRLIENRGQADERVLNEDRGDTTARLVDEFVTELDGGDGDLVSFAEANRVQRVVDAIFDSEGELRELTGA